MVMLGTCDTEDMAEPGPAADLSIPHPLQRTSVLVLDDSAFDRHRIRRLSEQSDLDIKLTEIASLSELRAELDAGAFDLILLDYNLPEGSGFEAMEMIRADPRHRDCPAIMVAGEERVSLVVDALRLGFIDFLAKKDLTVDRLHEAISEALTEGSGRGVDPVSQREAAALLVDDFLTAQLGALQPGFQSVLDDLKSLRAKAAAQPELARDTALLQRRLSVLWDLMKASRREHAMH